MSFAEIQIFSIIYIIKVLYNVFLDFKIIKKTFQFRSLTQCRKIIKFRYSVRNEGDQGRDEELLIKLHYQIVLLDRSLIFNYEQNDFQHTRLNFPLA